MKDKYYSKDEINKRIIEKLKPQARGLMERLRQAALRRKPKI